MNRQPVSWLKTIWEHMNAEAEVQKRQSSGPDHDEIMRMVGNK